MAEPLDDALRRAPSSPPDMRDEVARRVLRFADGKPTAVDTSPESGAAALAIDGAEGRVRDGRADRVDPSEAWPVTIRYTPPAAAELDAFPDGIASRSPQGRVGRARQSERGTHARDLRPDRSGHAPRSGFG